MFRRLRPAPAVGPGTSAFCGEAFDDLACRPGAVYEAGDDARCGLAPSGTLAGASPRPRVAPDARRGDGASPTRLRGASRGRAAGRHGRRRLDSAAPSDSPEARPARRARPPRGQSGARNGVPRRHRRRAGLAEEHVHRRRRRSTSSGCTCSLRVAIGGDGAERPCRSPAFWPESRGRRAAPAAPRCGWAVHLDARAGRHRQGGGGSGDGRHDDGVGIEQVRRDATVDGYEWRCRLPPRQVVPPLHPSPDAAGDMPPLCRWSEQAPDELRQPVSSSRERGRSRGRATASLFRRLERCRPSRTNSTAEATAGRALAVAEGADRRRAGRARSATSSA